MKKNNLGMSLIYRGSLNLNIKEFFLEFTEQTTM